VIHSRYLIRRVRRWYLFFFYKAHIYFVLLDSTVFLRLTDRAFKTLSIPRGWSMNSTKGNKWMHKNQKKVLLYNISFQANKKKKDFWYNYGAWCITRLLLDTFFFIIKQLDLTLRSYYLSRTSRVCFYKHTLTSFFFCHVHIHSFRTTLFLEKCSRF
jgi:hypothetical protein